MIKIYNYKINYSYKLKSIVYKIKIINKMKDMNGIIINNELNLTKWNTSNKFEISILWS